MDLALILLITSIIAGAVAGALVRTWSIHRRLYSLEDRLVVVEGVTQREVKIRAAQARPSRQLKDEMALEQLKVVGSQSAKFSGPWWMNPALKVGGMPGGTVR